MRSRRDKARCSCFVERCATDLFFIRRLWAPWRRNTTCLQGGSCAGSLMACPGRPKPSGVRYDLPYVRSQCHPAMCGRPALWRKRFLFTPVCRKRFPFPTGLRASDGECGTLTPGVGESGRADSRNANEPVVCQSLPFRSTGQPAASKRPARSCLRAEVSSRCTRCRPATSLNGRIAPSCTSTVRFAFRPMAIPASNKTFGRACPVSCFSYGSSRLVRNSCFSHASSSGVMSTTTA